MSILQRRCQNYYNKDITVSVSLTVCFCGTLVILIQVARWQGFWKQKYTRCGLKQWTVSLLLTLSFISSDNITMLSEQVASAVDFYVFSEAFHLTAFSSVIRGEVIVRNIRLLLTILLTPWLTKAGGLEQQASWSLILGAVWQRIVKGSTGITLECWKCDFTSMDQCHFVYDEVFAPVARATTFRTQLLVAAEKNYIVQHFDIKIAFLNGHLRMRKST